MNFTEPLSPDGSQDSNATITVGSVSEASDGKPSESQRRPSRSTTELDDNPYGLLVLTPTGQVSPHAGAPARSLPLPLGAGPLLPPVSPPADHYFTELWVDDASSQSPQLHLFSAPVFTAHAPLIAAPASLLPSPVAAVRRSGGYINGGNQGPCRSDAHDSVQSSGISPSQRSLSSVALQGGEQSPGRGQRLRTVVSWKPCLEENVGFDDTFGMIDPSQVSSGGGGNEGLPARPANPAPQERPTLPSAASETEEEEEAEKVSCQAEEKKEGPAPSPPSHCQDSHAHSITPAPRHPALPSLPNETERRRDECPQQSKEQQNTPTPPVSPPQQQQQRHGQEALPISKQEEEAEEDVDSYPGVVAPTPSSTASRRLRRPPLPDVRVSSAHVRRSVITTPSAGAGASTPLSRHQSQSSVLSAALRARRTYPIDVLFMGGSVVEGERRLSEHQSLRAGDSSTSIRGERRSYPINQLFHRRSP